MNDVSGFHVSTCRLLLGSPGVPKSHCRKTLQILDFELSLVTDAETQKTLAFSTQLGMGNSCFGKEMSCQKLFGRKRNIFWKRTWDKDGQNNAIHRQSPPSSSGFFHGSPFFVAFSPTFARCREVDMEEQTLNASAVVIPLIL